MDLAHNFPRVFYGKGSMFTMSRDISALLEKWTVLWVIELTISPLSCSRGSKKGDCVIRTKHVFLLAVVLLYALQLSSTI